ncbi:MAG: hypothetical protein QOD26_2242 [Betaproteobacteria bacterium]|jgi:hypothetical protein|nr:hypothetical protein [Betaproteobacteria bacterium]
MTRLALIALLALAGCKTANFPVSKPGTSKEQSDRDIAQCEDRARNFMRGRAASLRDQGQAYNRLVIDCLRDRGYSMSGE